MSEQNKHIDELFREQMEQHREQPPAGVWDAIESRLDLDKKPLLNPVSYKWVWYVAIIALLAVLGYFVAKSFSEKNKNEKSNEPITQITADQLPQMERKEQEETTEEVVARTMKEASTEKIEEAKENKDQNPAPGKVSKPESENKNKAAQTGGMEKKDATKRIKGSPGKSKENGDAGAKNHSNSKTKELKNKAARKNTDGEINDNTTPAKGKTSAKKNKESSSKNKEAKKQAAETKDANPLNESNADNKKKNSEKSETGKTTNAKAAKEKKSETAKKKAPAITPAKEKNKEAKPAEAETANAKPPMDAKPSAAKKTELDPEPAKEKKKAAKPVEAETTKAKPPKDEKSSMEKKKAAKLVSATANKTKPAKDVTSEPAKKKEINVEPAKEKKKIVKATESETTEKKQTKEEGSAVKLSKKSKIKEIDETGKSAAKQNSTSNENKETKTGIAANAAKSQGKVSENAANLKKQEAEENKTAETTKDENKEDLVNPFDEENKEEDKGNASPGMGSEEPRVPLRDFGTNRMIAAGVKLGLDRGFGTVTSTNFILSPFLQWNISEKFSLLLQPGIRYSSINSVKLYDDQAFHRILSKHLDSAHIIVLDTTQQPDSIQRNYYLQHLYDSILVSTRLEGQHIFEFDLPVMVQYKISEHLNIFGGINLSFGKIVQTKYSESLYNLQRNDTLSYPMIPVSSTGTTPTPDYQNYFNYNTPDYSTFNNTLLKNPTTNPVRFGYVLGLSYELKQQFLIDIMVRQNLSNMNYIPNEQVRKIYTQPYVRISVGYKFIKPERKKERSAGL